MIKDLFSPRTVFGLQIDGTYIRAVQVSNPTGSPAVERMFSQKIENPDEIGQELSGFLKKEKLKPELLITSLPTSSASVRQIDITLDNPKKLEKIIKYQMEPYVPYAIDEMVVDFFAPEPDEPVTITGVRKEYISEHLGILAQAGLNSDIVTLEDAALLFLYLNERPEKTDEPVVLVHLKGEETVVQVVRKNRLDFIRVVQGGANDPSALKETLALYRLKHDDLTIKEILITGPAAADSSKANHIESVTGIRTSVWKPFERVKNGLGDIGEAVQAEFSVPLGLAVGMLNASPKKLDLRKEEFRLKTTFDLKNMAIYGLSAILLFLGLFTFDLFHRLSVWEGKYQALNRRLSGILVDTFPETAAIRGRELDQMKQAILTEKGRYLWLEDITDSGSVLDLLLGMTAVFAAHRDVKVDNVSSEGIRILLDGRASSFKTVDVLKGKLESAGIFKTIRLIGAKMDNQDKMVKFGFHLEKKK